MQAAKFEEKSYWMTTREYSPGDSLHGEIDVDVAIVGGGFTGLFPVLKDIKFTHEWGGPVSVPLDMAPAIGYAGDKNVVYSLGTVGHGVSMTQLNGRTVADLILERQTELTNVFFVNRRTIPWPPEPLRNLTIKAILGYMHWEDRIYDPPSIIESKMRD